MSIPRDFSRYSWRLKVKRAEKHFEELDAKVRDYLDRYPYEARRQQQGDRKRHVWRYVLHVTEQPDPEVAIIMGDVVHNLRSALDHLAVAIAPHALSTSAGFPIEDPDAWAEDAAGTFVPKNKETGERFARRTKGIPDGALAIIEDLQPHRSRVPEDHPLRILSRLENAEKHRKLIPVLAGLHSPQSIMTRRGLPVGLGWVASGFCEDGAVVAEETFPLSGIPDESEVEVEVSGIPVVALRIGPREADTLIPWRLRKLIEAIPAAAFDDLERFVRM